MATIISGTTNILRELTDSKQMADVMREISDDNEQSTSIPVGLPQYLMSVFDNLRDDQIY